MSKLEELKKFLEEAKDDKEVKEFMNNLTTLSSEKVDKYLKSDDGKKLLQPILDNYSTKSIETWQKNNLEKIKADAIAASKNETTEQKQIREINEKLIASEKARVKESIRNKSLQEIQAKQLPIELLELIATAETEDGVLANISKVSDVFKNYSDKLNADFQAANGRKVTIPGKTQLTKEILKTLTPQQILQFPQEEIDAVLAQ